MRIPLRIASSLIVGLLSFVVSATNARAADDAPAASDKEAGFVELFNGKDLTGWIGDTKGYVAEDGRLVCRPGGNLYTEKEYGDFVLRFDFKLTPGANNGLGIRTPPKGDAAYVGLELQILDDTADQYKNLQPWQYHGSVYGLVPPKRGHQKPVGEWNSQEVTARGSKIKVVLNGATIIDTDLAKLKQTSDIHDFKKHPGMHNEMGHIGFLGHGSVVEFRNIRLKELNEPKTTTSAPEKMWVYVGTYTKGTKSQGVYAFELDMATGKLTPVDVVGGVDNPSFLAVGPEGKFLYAVGEVSNFSGPNTGSVAAYSLDPSTGMLKLLGQQSSRGGAPCHLSVTPDGRYVLVANYSGGSIAALPIEKDGSLRKAVAFVQHTGSSVNKQRQEGPHGHAIHLDPSGKRALAADLGLDKVLIYRFDNQKGTLTPNDPPAAVVAPGSGPRHFAFSGDGKTLYVLNEIAATITAFSYDSKTGATKELQTVSTVPEGFTGGNSTAEIAVHPGGRFLYASNRGHNSLAIFAIDTDTGKLTPVGHQSTLGKIPRSFAIDPTGNYVFAANQNSNSVVVFRVDQATGKLTPTGHQVEVPAPVCVVFAAKDA